MIDRPGSDRVAIVVVNYNGGAKLRTCLESMLETAPGAEIVVLDNASTDGSGDLPDLGKRVRIIRNPVNAGYAAALNSGAASTDADFLIFCNMDIVAEQGWLDPLVDVLRERREAGAVNPLILLADGKNVNAAGQAVHVTGLGFNRGLGTPPERHGLDPFEVSGIQGAVFGMRREAYEAIGGLDATGFLYHEDVNVSWLLRLAGYRLYCVPRARVRHDYFLSMYAEKFHLLERNRVAMLLSYTTFLTRTVMFPLLLLTEAFAWMYAILRRHGFVAAKWRSYRWVAGHRADIEKRRVLARRLRKRSDAAVLLGLSWSYDWRQFRVLARERGLSRRRPNGSLPVHD